MKDKRTIVAVLEDLPSFKPPLDHLLELLPRLQARYYSISSSSKVGPLFPVLPFSPSHLLLFLPPPHSFFPLFPHLIVGLINCILSCAHFIDGKTHCLLCPQMYTNHCLLCPQMYTNHCLLCPQMYTNHCLLCPQIYTNHCLCPLTHCLLCPQIYTNHCLLCPHIYTNHCLLHPLTHCLLCPQMYTNHCLLRPLTHCLLCP